MGKISYTPKKGTGSWAFTQFLIQNIKIKNKKSEWFRTTWINEKYKGVSNKERFQEWITAYVKKNNIEFKAGVPIQVDDAFEAYIKLATGFKTKKTKKELVIKEKSPTNSPKVKVSKIKKKKIIVIDPGHGDVYNTWLDPGALGIADKHEKDYALNLSKAIGDKLEESGYKIIYTRTKDIKKKQQRWKWRTDVSNKAKADCFISFHLNSSPNKKVNYFMVGYYSKEGKKLAESIVNSVKQKGFSSCKAEKHGYYVLKHTDSVSVLIEAGFITNPNNTKIIESESFIKQIFRGIKAAVN